MIRYALSNMLRNMQDRYSYDVSYMQKILDTDLTAFLKFYGFQTMSAHTGDLPAEILFAARIRSIISGDCGPCTQLTVDMALESGVKPEVIHAIVANDLPALPASVAQIVQFTELVLAHDPEADELRENIRKEWGEKGLIALAYSISACRVYPALKYALGHGQACNRIQIKDLSLAPG